jgi:hypothetical protein
MTCPAGDSAVHNGTPAVQDTSIGRCGAAASAMQKIANCGPTGGLPFVTDLIGIATGTRPLIPGLCCALNFLRAPIKERHEERQGFMGLALFD